jgi:hypothetical protein
VSDEATPAPPDGKLLSNLLRRLRRPWENPATILLKFRDGHATDMETLLDLPDGEALRKEMGRGLSEAEERALQGLVYKKYEIFRKVQELIGAGLLKADDPGDYELEKTKIHVTPLLRKIQNALDLSLTSLSTI